MQYSLVCPCIKYPNGPGKIMRCNRQQYVVIHNCLRRDSCVSNIESKIQPQTVTLCLIISLTSWVWTTKAHKTCHKIITLSSQNIVGTFLFSGTDNSVNDNLALVFLVDCHCCDLTTWQHRLKKKSYRDKKHKQSDEVRR